MITLKTHPQFYRPLNDVDGNNYMVPKWIWNQLSDDVRDEVRESYKTAKPDELDNGIIDEVKFSTWYDSEVRADRDFYQRAIVKTACIPVGESLPREGERYDILTAQEINGIVNFTRPSIPGKDSAPTAAPASETSTVAKSADTPSA